MAWRVITALALVGWIGGVATVPAQDRASRPVDAATLRGKVMAGYQGWFRTPGDPTGQGYVHWSRDPARVTRESLTVEMWPDLAGFPAGEQHVVPGFTHPDGRPAALFSSDNPSTVRRHFGWLRDHAIDGVWLQHFLVDCPGGPIESRFASRLRVLGHVRAAAAATGRTWALTLDLSGLPPDRIFEVLTREWRRLVESGVTRDPRYLHQNGLPVVEVFGYYHGGPDDRMTVELANRITDFFHDPGAGRAFLIGAGDWNWRANPDPAWQAALARLDGISPWNVGNTSLDPAGDRRATTNTWLADRRLCQSRGQVWLPVVYPGFGWDNLQHLPPGQSTIPRRGGRFFWEQFAELSRLGADTAFVAMFDEVDEGTAIFPISNQPPTQAHFLTFDGLPPDWYLRLTGEGTRMLRGERPLTPEIPLRPVPGDPSGRPASP